MSITHNAYGAWTFTTAAYPGKGTGNELETAYLGLGLVGETIELWEKSLFQHASLHEQIKELGDIAWYLHRTILAAELQPDTVFDQQMSYPPLRFSGDMVNDMVLTAGKIAEIQKKALRSGARNPLALEAALIHMAGLWCATAFALNSTPAAVLLMNIDKIESRKSRGTLQGSGDNR